MTTTENRPAIATCPLPHCDAELRLSVTSDFVVEDTVTPVSDLDQRHALVDYWEVGCIEGHVVDSGGRETDGRAPILGLRSALSLAGLR
jgi:hypothetical protein